MMKLISKSYRRIHRSGWIAAIAFLTVLPAIAQNAQPSDFPTIPAALEKKLVARASKVDAVTLNKNMLNFGGQFLNSRQKDDRQAQQLIQKLNAIYVREYDFDKPGAYTEEDLKIIRKQFLGPEWNPMVQERSKEGGGNSDVYVRLVNGEVHGMFVLDAEPQKLDLVYISGSIDPKQLGELGGNFGIPKINQGTSSAKPTK